MGGCATAGCCGAAACVTTQNAAAKMATETRARISEPQARTRLHLPHRVRPIRETELRGAEDPVHTGVRHAVQHVERVDPPIEIQSRSPGERARDSGVQREL